MKEAKIITRRDFLRGTAGAALTVAFEFGDFRRGPSGAKGQSRPDSGSRGFDGRRKNSGGNSPQHAG